MPWPSTSASFLPFDYQGICDLAASWHESSSSLAESDQACMTRHVIIVHHPAQRIRPDHNERNIAIFNQSEFFHDLTMSRDPLAFGVHHQLPVTAPTNVCCSVNSSCIRCLTHLYAHSYDQSNTEHFLLSHIRTYSTSPYYVAGHLCIVFWRDLNVK